MVWCVVGDCNAIRKPEEMKGSSQGDNKKKREIIAFNQFIENIENMDLLDMVSKTTFNNN